MTAFIEGLPKAELHLHIEGTIEPDTLFRLARRNGIGLPHDSVEALRGAYDFDGLQDFLDLYYQGMAVLQTEEDFYQITWAYLDKAHSQNILHAEIFFDPQGHTSRGIAFETVLGGIWRALEDGRGRLGIGSRLIPCILRDRGIDEAMATLERVLLHRDRIIAIGLDSAEKNNPPGKFSEVFDRARAEGLLTVAHAGEEGPADYVPTPSICSTWPASTMVITLSTTPRSSSASPVSVRRSPFVRCRTCACGWSTTSTATLCGR